MPENEPLGTGMLGKNTLPGARGEGGRAADATESTHANGRS